METVEISTEYIRLDSLMKLSGLVETGGQAKLLIQSGEAIVNGKVCTQRGKKLRDNDTLEFEGRRIVVRKV